MLKLAKKVAKLGAEVAELRSERLDSVMEGKSIAFFFAIPCFNLG